MNNWIVLPIILPLLAGMVAVFFRQYPMAQRAVVLAGLLAAVAASLVLLDQVSNDGVQVLHVGGWQAPFGITLAADMMSALLVLTACIVGLACLLYAFGSIGKERERHYVYPIMMVLICGVNGSFLTGDLFNLFVFFEVMLISSYVLISMGGEKVQLRESIKYVLINMLSSTLFVMAIAYMYSIVGTLNMAHISERVAEAGQTGLMTTVSLLFLVVFGIKAALLLFIWLPDSYSNAPFAVSALFAALLTKVGIYSILRVFTLIFYHEPQVTHTLMIWMGALTMILGAMGAVSHWGIRKILAYNIIVSVGFVIFAVGISSEQALSGALYYLIHDMLAKALIFILGGTIISMAGTDRLLDIKGLIRYRPALGWLFLLGVLAVAGIPPLSGFVGKVMILQAGVEHGSYAVSVIGLLTSLLVLYSLMKVFIQSFWGETFIGEGEALSTGREALLPATILAILLIGLGLGAQWVLELIGNATDIMVQPALYIDAVLVAD